ncbi:MAG: type II secretion system F family protein [Lachnospiraceae bacterium]|nr:type II secretion system F family protein [Desulfovibrio sp.]MBR4605803.1 type II secretion system F family protein [Lachnospiraceae bacterium]
MTTTVRILCLMFFGAAERQRVWNKLSVQIDNRMSLDDSLVQLYRHAKETKSPLEEIYDHILKTIARGHTLGEALKNAATMDEITLINSAQTSGKLAEGLKFAAKVLDAKGKIKKALLENLTSPILMFIACLAMLILISVQVIPQLAMVSDPSTWEGSSWLLYTICSFVTSPFGIGFGIFLLVALVLICISFTRCTGRLRRFLDNHLPWSIYRMSVGTGWLYTISIRMSAGHQLAKILESMAQTPSRYLREIVNEILKHSRHGENFGFALTKSGMNFPSKEVVDDLQIYASMPGFQDQLIKLADTWLNQGVVEVQKLASKIGTAVYLIIIAQMALVSLVASNFQDQVQMGM